MECTRCHKILPVESFSYKNVAKKIYYVHCNSCREKLAKKQPNKKQNEKEKYEITKRDNVIHCECGRTYVAFRNFHINRHVNSKYHLASIEDIRNKDQ
jgi:hypothetical protein